MRRVRSLRVGRFLRECPSPAVSSVQIATKFAAYPWRITPGSIVQAARESAARLGKETVELGQLHWSTGNYQPLQERALWAGIADAYDQGVIKAVGLSNYGPKQLRRIHAYMSDRGVPIATLQVQYHLLSRFPVRSAGRSPTDRRPVFAFRARRLEETSSSSSSSSSSVRPTRARAVVRHPDLNPEPSRV